MKMERYFLAQDESSHWYVVPVERREEWHVWAALPEDDEQSWEAPEYATRLGGGPERVTFCDWKEG